MQTLRHLTNSQSNCLHVLTCVRHRQKVLQGIVGVGRKSIIPILLKVQTAAGYLAIDLRLPHSIACGNVLQCSQLGCWIASQSLFSLLWATQSTYKISNKISPVVQHWCSHRFSSASCEIEGFSLMNFMSLSIRRKIGLWNWPIILHIVSQCVQMVVLCCPKANDSSPTHTSPDRLLTACMFAKGLQHEGWLSPLLNCRWGLVRQLKDFSWQRIMRLLIVLWDIYQSPLWNL